MKKFTLLIFVMLVATCMALAQSNPSGTPPTYSGTAPNPGTLPYGVSNTATGAAGFNAALGQDVLGAHNGYGRGCVMCHAPHGGALGNNAPAGTNPMGGTPPAPLFPNGGAAASSDVGNGTASPLWGENLAPYYGATVNVTGNAVALPANAAAAGTYSGATTVLLCLSCHDGALTKPAMMAGTTVEALPIVGGSAPTLFGTTAGNSALNYVNEHPVGATPSLYGGKTSGSLWGCTINTTTAFSATTCAASSTPLTNFEKNYPASIWNSSSSGGLATFANTVNGVTCTTCHNQHSMTVFKAANGNFYPTMFFIRGNYMPSTGGNSVAQFCRNCHSGEANEENGLTSVPTT